jgi:STE24 endopeptidase
MLVVLGYTAIVYFCHWPAIVDVLGIGEWVLLDELLVVAPFFLMILISFHITWTAEHSLDLHDFALVEYLLFQTRQLLLPVLPIFLFVLLGDLVVAASSGGVRWVAEAKIVADHYPFVQWIGFGTLFLGLYCVMPFAMRIFWGLKPLPAGPVRDRLDEFSRREGFRAREILLWPTGGNILNAAVIGIAGPVRYVLMTDALVENLDLDEVEAVFAHEVGHAKHNHLFKFFLFFIGYTLLMYLVVDNFQGPLESLIGDSILGSLAFLIGAIFVWFGLLMGFVSRRFEQQADVYGATATGRGHEDEQGEHPFIRALERIALQMGDIREMKGWRHFSLGSRIDFIDRFVRDPEERRLYRRRIAALLIFFFGLLGTIGVAAGFTVPRQVREGRTAAAMARARWLGEHGRPAEALATMFEALDVRANLPSMSPEELRLQAMRETAASKVRPPPEGFVDILRAMGLYRGVNPADRFAALFKASRLYLALEMPGAARLCLEEILMMTEGLELGPGIEASILELIGLSLAAEGYFRGAHLAFSDALALLPEESGAAARLRQLLARPDPGRKR